MEAIKKKAHLNDKTLYTETIPMGVLSIEDWAYSGCCNLDEIYMPSTVKNISHKAFKGCDKLDNIFIYENDPELVLNNAPHLLALAVKKWPEKTGELVEKSLDPEVFLRLYDELLVAFLDEPDEVGFDPFPAGGEEDYEGEENDLPLYMMRKQEQKAHMIYERLRCDMALNDEIINGLSASDNTDSDVYITYLKQHRTDAAFTFLLRHSLYENAYRKIYLELKLPEKEELPTLIELSEEDVELKSMLIRYGQSMKDMEGETETSISKKYEL